jgi:hypothetical protein
MAKKLQDIKVTETGEVISLSNKKEDDKKKLKKTPNILRKQKDPIKKMKDIQGEEESKFIYIKGTKFTPPKFLGNLLKIGIVGFLILLMINSANVYYKGKKLEREISAQAYEGYSFLVDAGRSATNIQFEGALQSFEKAILNFGEAKKTLWFISSQKSFYDRSDSVIHGINNLLNAGKHVAIAGGYFLEAVEKFNKIPLFFVAKNAPEEELEFSITEILEEGLEKVDLAIEEIAVATELMLGVDEKSFPTEISARITFAKKQIEEISEILNATAEHFPAVLKLMGNRHPHRYLILLQNNNEIRATGGFIGSYAIIDISEGEIINLQVEDVYDIDGSYGGYIEPPEGLRDFVDNWRFRDSNYSPDFAVSGAKAKWFLEKQGGPGADTVIAINQGLLRDMLEISGPVQVGRFGKLNSENYNLLLSYVIEGKVWGPEDPKHILKVFIPAFKESILKEQNIGAIGSKLYRALQQKHIMMYSSDPQIQNLFDSAGLSGRVYITQEKEDYLSVINTSVGGTKSDKFVEENIRHTTYIDKNGEIINEVTIKRSHLWTDEIYFYWKRILESYGFKEMPDYLIDILGRGRNKVQMRVFVPEGSVLLSSSDENIITRYDADIQKTYFFTVMEINAGEVGTVNIKYQLPFTLNFKKPADTYRLIVQKQPGSRGSILNKTVEADSSIRNLEYFPSTGRKDAANRIIYATNLVYDRHFATIWKR